MKYNFRYIRPKALSFGVADPLEFPQPPELHVFVLLDGSLPKCLSFADDHDGLEAVSQMVRSDDVISIVRGKRVPFTLSTVTTLQLEQPYVNEQVLRTRYGSQEADVS